MNLTELNEFINQIGTACSPSAAAERTNAFNRIKTYLNNLREALLAQAMDNNQLVIAIVGQMKAGKSSLLNALIFDGIDVLPVAPTPMTAGLTVIQYEDNPENQRFEVEYYTREEWDDIKGKSKLVEETLRQIKKENPEYKGGECKTRFEEICKSNDEDFEVLWACHELYENMKAHEQSGMKIGQPNDTVQFLDLTDVAGRLEPYVSAKGEYSAVVKAVYLYISSNLLKYTNISTGLRETYKIVDTPGINDPVESRDRVAKTFLREAHAAIMLIRSDRTQTQTDLTFLNGNIIKGGMSKVLLTFSRLDNLFECEEKLPKYLLDAMEDYVGYIDGEYEAKGKLYEDFNKSIKPRLTNGEGVMYTMVCALVEQIRLKLEKSGGDLLDAKLSEEETGLFRRLQEWFPEDFNEENSELLDNLMLLGGVEHMKEGFLLKEFLANKDSIVAKRYADRNRLLHDKIVEQFDVEVKKINDNQQLLDSIDLKDLENQVKILEELKDNGLKLLYDCVETTINKLKVFVDKSLFADKLVSYKVKLDENDAILWEFVKYTRKGTNRTWFGGNVKREEVQVKRVQPESVVKNHSKQIDVLNGELKKRWKDNFLKERDLLVQSLLDSIRNIANTDKTLGIDASVYTYAIDKVIDNVLIGREVLDTGSWIDLQKIELDKFTRKSDHLCLDTNFSETRMEPYQAKEKIEKQANERVTDFISAIEKRYSDFYSGLKQEVLKEIEELSTKLDSFVENVSCNLGNVFNQFITEKKQLIGDRQKVEQEKRELIADLKCFKEKFEKL